MVLAALLLLAEEGGEDSLRLLTQTRVLTHLREEEGEEEGEAVMTYRKLYKQVWPLQASAAFGHTCFAAHVTEPHQNMAGLSVCVRSDYTYCFCTTYMYIELPSHPSLSLLTPSHCLPSHPLTVSPHTPSLSLLTLPHCLPSHPLTVSWSSHPSLSLLTPSLSPLTHPHCLPSHSHCLPALTPPHCLLVLTPSLSLLTPPHCLPALTPPHCLPTLTPPHCLPALTPPYCLPSHPHCLPSHPHTPLTLPLSTCTLAASPLHHTSARLSPAPWKPCPHT